jgi:hypothetical protein
MIEWVELRRRYDYDWLGVLAVLFLIPYNTAPKGPKGVRPALDPYDP